MRRNMPMKMNVQVSVRESLRSLAWFFLAMVVVLTGGTGCQTAPPVAVSDTVPYLDVRLREGDTLKISFPGAPNLDSTYQIRRDGKITLTLGGEITAAGLTPTELEKEILRVYEAQLAVKQVVVLATSSGYPIYVSGAVLRPGKLTIERPITVVEAIMEAGGFDRAKADPKKVSILRQIDGKSMTFKVDVQAMIDGKQPKPFYLKPSDIVTVPEKFVWF
jgi:protein involved in polysaccharide export with SLBB domain